MVKAGITICVLYCIICVIDFSRKVYAAYKEYIRHKKEQEFKRHKEWLNRNKSQEVTINKFGQLEYEDKDTKAIVRGTWLHDTVKKPGYTEYYISFSALKIHDKNKGE